MEELLKLIQINLNDQTKLGNDEVSTILSNTLKQLNRINSKNDFVFITDRLGKTNLKYEYEEIEYTPPIENAFNTLTLYYVNLIDISEFNLRNFEFKDGFYDLILFFDRKGKLLGVESSESK